MSSDPHTKVDSTARLRLVTLGDAVLGVYADNGEFRIIPLVGKQLALVAYLACRPKRTASREHLIDLLWERLPPEKARDALRDLMRQIKQKIGNECLGAPGSNSLVLTENIDSDRDLLLNALKRGDSDAVVDAYRGEFLPGFEGLDAPDFQHWVDGERASLRRIFVHAAREVVRERLRGSRSLEALDLARDLRDLDELDQTSWRLLIECLIARDDHLGLSIEVERWGELQEREDFEPEEATLAMLARALSASSAVSSDPIAANVPRLIADLVGRESEVSLVLRLWDQARNRSFTHLHIVAPAGIGKSRLLADVFRRLRARPIADGGTRPVQIRASYGSRHFSHAFASDFVRSLVELRGASGIPEWAANELVALNPSLCDLFPSATPDAVASGDRFHRLSLAVHELVRTLVVEQPLAIFLDDLHWSHIDSLRLLAAAFGNFARLPVLLLSTGRDRSDALCEATHAQHLSLSALAADSVAVLVSSLARLPEDAWAEQLPLSLWDATRGSPLLVLETLQLLIDRHLLEQHEGAWVSSDPRALLAALGEGSAVRHRVEALESGEREVLLLLATSGAPLSTRQLVAAAGDSPEIVDQSLAALERRGLVSRQGEEWTTAHDEHASASLDAASEQEVRAAAVSVGRSIAADTSGDIRQQQRAASLLARGMDVASLSRFFERFVRKARLEGDRRSLPTLAHELLGTSGSAEVKTDLVRSVPWLVRIGLVSPQRITAALAATTIAVLVAALIGTELGQAQPKPDTVLAALRLSTDGQRYDVFEVPLEAKQWAGVSAMDVRLRGSSAWSLPSSGVGGKTLRPDGRGWTGGRTVSDSGILDVFNVNLDGSSRRLTFARGDDYMVSWAPDNSAFVFATGRWSPRARYDLAVYDSLTRHVRALTRGDDWDTTPAWSSDGSRIAFVRQPSQSGESVLCVVDVDGSQERCVTSPSGRVDAVVGWSDAHRAVITSTKANISRLVRVDVESREEDIIDPNASAGATYLSPDGRWVVCSCARRGYAAGSWILYPLERSNEFKPLRVAGAETRSVYFEFAPTAPRAPFVARLHILSGPGSPLLGAPYQLRVSGEDSTGRAIEPGIVRWRSMDTTITTIDSAGILLPRRTGRVTIEASAGGWRRVLTDVTIREVGGRTLFEDDRTHGFATAWIRFGDPKPVIVPNEHLWRGFLNNGDGVFFSGAYSTASYPTGGGLWLEVTLSAPLTEPEWQEQLASLFTLVDSTQGAVRDHERAEEPRGGAACLLRYPKSGGGQMRGDSLGLQATTMTPQNMPAPRGAREGRPFQVLIQIFPDGRCGFAVDRVPVLVTPPVYLGPTAHVMLEGNSADTRILIGRVRVSSGLADVTWGDTAVRARVAGTNPRG